ncbi:hypothetical protein J6590_015101 [Homalodisca vitripennis]|nr:hypothetical protein J6590_015101 [Homalodisca vitripennis]
MQEYGRPVPRLSRLIDLVCSAIVAVVPCTERYSASSINNRLVPPRSHSVWKEFVWTFCDAILQSWTVRLGSATVSRID